jgi:hypothetical protein
MLPKEWLINTQDGVKPLYIDYIQGIDAEFDALKNEHQCNEFLGHQKVLLKNLHLLIARIDEIKNAETNENKRYAMKIAIQCGRELERKILIMIIKVRKKLKIFDDDDNELTQFLTAKVNAKREKDAEAEKLAAKKIKK